MAQGKSRGCMIVLGIFGFFAILIGIGMVFLFIKAKDVFEDFTTGMQVTPAVQRQINELANEYPFKSPADGRMDEERLGVFMDIKADIESAIRDWEEKFEKELDAKGREDFDFQGVTEALQVFKEFRFALLDALRSHEMSLEEYIFYSDIIYPYGAGTGSIGSRIREWLEGGDLTRSKRSRADRPDREDTLPENQRLIDRYFDELDRLDTGGLELMGLR